MLTVNVHVSCATDVVGIEAPDRFEAVFFSETLHQCFDLFHAIHVGCPFKLIPNLRVEGRVREVYVDAAAMKEAQDPINCVDTYRIHNGWIVDFASSQGVRFSDCTLFGEAFPVLI